MKKHIDRKDNDDQNERNAHKYFVKLTLSTFKISHGRSQSQTLRDAAKLDVDSLFLHFSDNKIGGQGTVEIDVKTENRV